MYGRTGNEDFSPLIPGTKEYKQAKNAREEMLEGFTFIGIKAGPVKANQPRRPAKRSSRGA
jgi:hypothetical protein